MHLLGKKMTYLDDKDHVFNSKEDKIFAVTKEKQ